ncbi:MAG: hypothetical protein ACJASG_001998 [Oleiphilaceae bacterium]
MRKQARQLTSNSLPSHLKHILQLESVNHRALSAFKSLQKQDIRKVDWDWCFAPNFRIHYPKAFDLSVWHGNSLCSLTLGRPIYKGTEMQLDFIEKFTDNPVFSGDMFGISLIAYEAYGKVIGAKQLRIMNPENDKLIKYYSSYNSFSYQKSLTGNPHHLVKSI